MNRCVFVGRLTKDPELRYTPGTGKAVCNFTLAVNRRFKTQGQPDADFFNIVVWNKQGEAAANNLVKGNQAAVAGEMRTRTYEAKDGTKKYVTELWADEVQFLTPKNNNQTNTQNTSDNDIDYDDEITPIDDGDIPF